MLPSRTIPIATRRAGLRVWPARGAAAERPAAKPRAGRQLSIDAARGGAMFFVCLSHFGAAYFPVGGAAQTVVERVGMIASPTFVLMSGLMVGFLFHFHRGAAESLRDKLVDRGLFQLLVGHVVVVLATLTAPYDLASALVQTQVTDVVGVALVAGAVLVPRLGPGRRLAVGAVVFAAQAAAAQGWTPASPFENAAYATLLGPTPDGARQSAFPVLPWLGWSMAGTALGSYLARYFARGDVAAAGRAMVRLGVAAIVVAVACKGAYHTLKVTALIAPNDALFQLTYLWGKYPPAPAYLLLFGGVGCVGLGGLMLADAAGRAGRALAALAVVGRASWPVFATQYVVYTQLERLAPPAELAFAPAVFAASLVPPILVARWWSARDLNRLLTVGYGRRRARPAPAAPAVVPVAGAIAEPPPAAAPDGAYPTPDSGRRSIPA